MRISRLDLLRYGKFTDRAIALPHAKIDFHLIVGPNEAGKSTLRSAILDLFFGIETRSNYNFLHPHTEMRLGALIEQDGKSLDFQRIKARKQTLFSPTGAPLTDDVLIPFLGTTDRTFFDHMFGLDHEKLVAGGNEILNASNDIGQILFQSAAGIGSLGTVRDALEGEANKLWAPRKSIEREYYAASDELASAEAALKQATVRTKDWVEARSSVERLDDEFGKAQEKYGHLEEERIRLERIRRVAFALNTLREKELELSQLGEVTVLPPEAEKHFVDAELELAKAGQEHSLLASQTNDILGQLEIIHPDERLLGRATDILALSERRQQVRNHESDIAKRQEEVDVHWKNIVSQMRQLGWPSKNEDELERRLPVLPVRTAIANLLKRHGVVEQALSSAKQAVRDKAAELSSLDAQIQALPSTNVSASLRSSLTVARSLGDVASLEKRLQSQVAKANRELKAASVGLGKWNLDIETLCGIAIPPAEEISSLQNRQAQYESSTNTLSERLAELHNSVRDHELEISQYRKAHHPVTVDELTEARVERDMLWSSIKSGAVAATAAATDYETRVQVADGVADRRHDKAQEVSELQAKLDSLKRMQEQVAELGRRIATIGAEKIAFQTEWSARADEIGLSEIPLLVIGDWVQTREKVLRTAETVSDARLALDELMRTASDARDALVQALVAEGLVMDATTSLATLIIAASDVVESAAQARVRLDEMKSQQHKANALMTELEEKDVAAREDWGSWEGSWRKNIALAGLKEETDVGTAEGALNLFAEIDEKLRAIQELRKARIETMQRDLRDFEEAAVTLVGAVAPDMEGQSPAAVAIELATRLAKATVDRSEFLRLSQELATKKGMLASAFARIESANAGILPLLRLAKAATSDALREAIARSDRWRALSDDIVTAKDTAQAGGDGLSLGVLEAELRSTDVSQIPAVLGDIDRRREEVLTQQNALSALRADAMTSLSKIAGQDEAARAESRRQGALARMANAAERYIKVFTAAKLLRWAIDRYRETKQGPMLARAGEIFSALTLGSFQKLVVDFDSEPLALEGQRADGRMVEISGMSDGSRDQLYLALRLAALELHLGQTQSLPFIADDLFINYDDGRAKAGLEALAELAGKTQVIFLSHHDHLVPTVQSVFGRDINIVSL